MSKQIQISLGIIITIIIFFTSNFLGSKFNFHNNFIPKTLGIHLMMFFLSLISIFVFKEVVNYRIDTPRFKHLVKPIVLTFLMVIFLMIITSILIKVLGYENETHPAMNQMNPLQVFVFVFIIASISEELLFRGFLQNILNPLKNKGIIVFKRNLSFPVLISGFLFGLAHLITMKHGVQPAFLFRIVLFTSVVGIIAGYYQEKYKNNAYAIAVHMTANLLGLIGAIMMYYNAS